MIPFKSCFKVSIILPFLTSTKFKLTIDFSKSITPEITKFSSICCIDSIRSIFSWPTLGLLSITGILISFCNLQLKSYALIVSPDVTKKFFDPSLYDNVPTSIDSYHICSKLKSSLSIPVQNGNIIPSSSITISLPLCTLSLFKSLNPKSLNATSFNLLSFLSNIDIELKVTTTMFPFFNSFIFLIPSSPL